METPKAGQNFVCGCCGTTQPEATARIDAQLGPICGECLVLTRWAQAYLKKAKIDRPLQKSDINNSNFNRIYPSL